MCRPGCMTEMTGRRQTGGSLQEVSVCGEVRSGMVHCHDDVFV